MSNWLTQQTGWIGEPWPVTAHRDTNGVLLLGGIRATKLANEFHTPLYVLDEADFRARATAYKKAFTDAFAKIGADAHLYYAGKALLSKAVARWAIQEGLFIDAASEGELTTALYAGVPPTDIGLHGNNKSDRELDLAVQSGIGQIIIDSQPEIDRLQQIAATHGVTVPVLVRVTTGVHAGGHEYISTAHEDQKFGLSINPPASQTDAASETDAAAMQALKQVLASDNLHLLGIHSHIGSQILDMGGFAEAAKAVLKLRAELAEQTGHLVEEIDLGGGFGIAYLPDEQGLDPHAIAAELAEVIETTCRDLGTIVPRVSFEPGRSIVGPAGVSLYTVGTIKPVTVTGADGQPFTRLYVAVDGGMGDNIRPALYQAAYHAELANRESAAELVPARIVGKHCESGDILVKDINLPADIQSGDILAMAATGAYGRSMASNYNLMPRPAVVAVASGDAQTILRRETVADLLALDVG